MPRKICTQCGRVWNLRKEKVPFNDNDSEDCLCGKELISWKGGQVYYVELIEGLPEDEDEDGDNADTYEAF